MKFTNRSSLVTKNVDLNSFSFRLTKEKLHF